MKNQRALKFGLLVGIGTVIFLFLCYWIDKKLILNPSLIWSTFIPYVLGMYFAGREERTENGGYLAFKPALKAAFLVYMVANIIYYSFNFCLFNFLDPEMLTVQKEYMLEEFQKREGFLNNSPSETVENQLKTYKEEISHLNYNFGPLFMSYLRSLIWGFLLAAIIGRMVRRHPFEIT